MSDSIENAIDVAYQTEIAIENKSTEQLTAEVNVKYRQAEMLARQSWILLADAGRRLIEIKSRIPHGQFLDWCEKNLEFSHSKAARIMKLASEIDGENGLLTKLETYPTIGISTVLALLEAPEEVAAEVIEENDIESMTVRELKAEISRIKEEKEAAERKAEMIDRNNDDIRKELASMQRKLSEAVSEEEFNEMQAAAQAQKEDLTKELNEAKAAAGAIQAKLDKAKEDLKKAKEKLKASEASKDEEIQERLAKTSVEIEEKAQADAHAAAEEEIRKAQEQVSYLSSQVEKLEAEKAKLSNTALMEFKVYIDQLQDIYIRLNDMISEESINDEEMGGKMRAALKTIIERWNV